MKYRRPRVVFGYSWASEIEVTLSYRAESENSYNLLGFRITLEEEL